MSTDTDARPASNHGRPSESVHRANSATPQDLSRPEVIRIASLKDGDRVDGLMACSRKTILTSNGGRTFLAVVLRDGQSSIEARSFTHVTWLASQFERGDVVHVRGQVVTFRNAPQIRIDEIERTDSQDRAAFLPVAHRDLEELDGFLEHLVREHVNQPGYRALLDSLLADRSLRRAWRVAPCTHDSHHAYLGGLLEHTVSVVTLAVETCALHPRLCPHLLVTAAVVHDLGYTRAFAYASEIVPNDAGQLVGHLELGIAIVREHAVRTGLSDRLWWRLAHCVLAHHGRSALAASAFQLPEALALYRINALDTEVKQAFERQW